MQRWLLIAILAGSLAAFGGVYTWATVPLFAASVIVALAGPTRTFQFPRDVRALDLALVAIAIGIALQLLPLPRSVADVLSPNAADVRAVVRVDARLANSPAHPLSVDPRATLNALLTYVSAVLVFWAARGALALGGARQLCRALALIAMVLCVEALVQRALTPTLIYGVWPPRDLGAQPFGPFVNRNHLAGWLLLTLPLVGGYLAARVRTRTSGARAMAATRLIATAGASLVIAFLTMLVTLLATLSRSGLLGAGAISLVAWRLARRRLEAGRNIAMPLFAVAGLVLVVVMATVDIDRWTQRLTSTLSPTETGRLTIWRESVPVARNFWVAGTGAGTYSTAMLVYQTSVVPLPHLRTVAHFNQAHSHYVQVAVEGGALLVLPVLFAVAFLIQAARRMLSTDRGEAVWVRIGAISALVGIAVQSIWETSLLVPANALLCAVVAAIVVHHRTTGDAEAPTTRHYTR